MTSFEEIEGALDDLVTAHGYDWGIRLETAHDCAWSAELRVTMEPNRRGLPDRSLITFAAGGGTPEEAAARAFAEMWTWVRDEAR